MLKSLHNCVHCVAGGGGGSGSVCVKEQPDQVEQHSGCVQWRQWRQWRHRAGSPALPDLELSTATPGYLVLSTIYYLVTLCCSIAHFLPPPCPLYLHSAALVSCVGTSLAAIPGQCSTSSHSTVQIHEQPEMGRAGTLALSSL